MRLKKLSLYCPVIALQVLILAPAAAQYAVDPEAVGDVLAGRPYSPYADRGFPTQVYFGDTHVHTALSADAGGGGTRLLPRDSYRFARGEQVVSNTGQPVKLSRPLDFYMITDHSDGMGVTMPSLSMRFLIIGAALLLQAPFPLAADKPNIRSNASSTTPTTTTSGWRA